MKPLFDVCRIRENQARTASRFSEHAFLFEDVENQILERLREIKRDFSTILLMGASTGILKDALHKRFPEAFIVSAERTSQRFNLSLYSNRVTFNFEDWCFRADSFDLVISTLTLHSLNDPLSHLCNIRSSLKNEGVFLGTFFGGETLKPLRDALLQTELFLTKGAHARIYPLISNEASVELLQKANFTWPMVDVDRVMVHYEKLITLLHDLRGMGEGNALIERSKATPSKKLFQNAEKCLERQNGRFAIPFDVIYFTGWKG
ncbi:class I SAM-dependent methyltransferase [Candidatus Nucleicultrix amoebiphila]|uniref:Methyltransferase type 11 domain-containing protein n=1 Tax=Candidatus Nucleicultrix amoebiphila FS5 TaxID=1414854 RepID=A0A1W6N4D3_9PROT|nr:methyltransferase domain-containing protein [Candidatus Nucleicultrix amoebiphila]ARN84631.1 hypothetical protein GQ61_04145 [Candidatus Nucleicultrix amoebiphila FS5]